MFVLCLATTHISYIAAFSVFSVSREVMIPISFVYANDVFREEEKEGGMAIFGPMLICLLIPLYSSGRMR